MRRVPASALTTGSTLSYVDLAAVFQRAGVLDGSEQQQTDAIVSALSEFDLAAPQLFGNRQFQFDEARREVGFTLLDIAQEVTLGSPPNLVTAAAVRHVSPASIDAAVHADPTWSDLLTTVTVDGVSFYDWGDKLDIKRRTPMRPIGAGGQLLVDAGAADGDSVIVRTSRRPMMESALAVDPEASVWASGPLASVWDHLPPGALVGAFGSISQLSPGAAPTPALAVLTLDGADVHAELLIPFESGAKAESAAAVIKAWLTEGKSFTTRGPIADLLPGATVSVDGTVVRLASPAPRAFGRFRDILVVRDLPPL